jgi:IstB-like ATP binding protein
MEALARGYLVRYTTLDDLVRHLRKADALGKLASKLTQLQRPHLLILDLRRHRNYADVRKAAGGNPLRQAGFATVLPAGRSA